MSNVMAIKSKSRTKTKPMPPDEWPVIWRVTAPGCGRRGTDLVFAQADASEAAARRQYQYLRRLGYPVRLERVSCGPLSPEAQPMLEKFRGLAAAVKERQLENEGAEPASCIGV